MLVSWRTVALRKWGKRQLAAPLVIVKDSEETLYQRTLAITYPWVMGKDGVTVTAPTAHESFPSSEVATQIRAIRQFKFTS